MKRRVGVRPLDPTTPPSLAPPGNRDLADALRDLADLVERREDAVHGAEVRIRDGELASFIDASPRGRSLRSNILWN